jgi:hypothetical protein
MATQIHTELKSLAGNNPAAYMSVSFVQMLTIQTTIISINKITGVQIPVGKQVLAARLEGANFSQDPMQHSRLTKSSNALSNQIGLTLNADLAVKTAFYSADWRVGPVCCVDRGSARLTAGIPTPRPRDR